MKHSSNICLLCESRNLRKRLESSWMSVYRRLRPVIEANKQEEIGVATNV
jgi:hypothetical protein